MESVRREGLLDVPHLEPRSDFQPELVVHGIAVALVDPAYGFERLARENRAGLRDGIPNFELEAVVERNRRQLAQQPSVLVDLAPAAVSEAAACLPYHLDRGRN